MCVVSFITRESWPRTRHKNKIFNPLAFACDQAVFLGKTRYMHTAHTHKSVCVCGLAVVDCMCCGRANTSRISLRHHPRNRSRNCNRRYVYTHIYSGVIRVKPPIIQRFCDIYVYIHVYTDVVTPVTPFRSRNRGFSGILVTSPTSANVQSMGRSPTKSLMSVSVDLQGKPNMVRHASSSLCSLSLRNLGGEDWGGSGAEEDGEAQIFVDGNVSVHIVFIFACYHLSTFTHSYMHAHARKNTRECAHSHVYTHTLCVVFLFVCFLCTYMCISVCVRAYL